MYRPETIIKIMPNKIVNLLKKKVVILDGAMGTELQKQGLPQGVCPEQWCIENPRVLQAIHRQYQNAGADIIYTCTFGANKLKLSQYNLSKVEKINRDLAWLACEAVNGKTLVAGDIGPTGQFIKPFGDLDFELAVDIFKAQARGLLAGGVDLFVIETMIDIQEARAALIAVKELTDKFTLVTMTYEKSGITLNGTDPVTALVILQSLGADAVGCNCSRGPEDMLKFISAMKPYAAVPLAAKPNAGIPMLAEGKTIFDMDEKEFASFGKKFVLAGVNMMGGCCGATPEHIARLKKAVGRDKPVLPKREAISVLASARKTVVLDKSAPLVIIGERINPSGKKLFKQELREGRLSLVRKMAFEQAREGARLLDVNVGLEGINEEKTMLSVLGFLSTVSDLPLVIDSSNVKVIEKALRFYPGRALINSISAKKDNLKKLLPLVKKYGAMFILLPLTDKEIPRSFAGRKKIIENVLNEVKKLSIPKENIIIDALVMSISSEPGAAEETLKTIEWISKTLNGHSVIGLSNVSFSLPGRMWINAAFLAMAQAKGLSLAIANPADSELMNIKRAGDLLTRKDKNAVFFIREFNKLYTREKESEPSGTDISPLKKVFNAILEGNREEIKSFIDQSLSSGVAPEKLVKEAMLTAIAEVGDLFDKKKYFLPQLIAGAETMKEAFEYLTPRLKKEKAGIKRPAVILLATVKGDIHDIGKNIVGLMLNNHGFKVIDLGKDVSADRIVKEIKKYKPALVGLSALMTTTMVNMKDVIEKAKQAGLTAKFLAGGAVVTKTYAQSIGAEYAKDGVDAVRVVKEIVDKNT